LLNRRPAPLALDLEQLDVVLLNINRDYRPIPLPLRIQLIGDHRECIMQLSESVRSRLNFSGNFDGVEHVGAQQPAYDENDDVQEVTEWTKEVHERMDTN
ncbi:hypothetical protein PMAYCL1PPCAC_32207, partial [Pristionchus mayeri]